MTDNHVTAGIYIAPGVSLSTGHYTCDDRGACGMVYVNLPMAHISGEPQALRELAAALIQAAAEAENVAAAAPIAAE